MRLERGATLGQYEIVSAIGAGGMGEVYRARDTKLGREVAIKVLPEELSKDKDRLARFEREAKLLAQLNHPNVATLYGSEDGYLVMELVEGETLAERIARGRIPVEEALSLFIQIAEGLEAAHEKGVIHRDLKPANVKVTFEGKVKILDFGLAKAFAPEADVSAETSQSPTLTKGTALGAILGTAAYMSPEQAKGHVVDKRTDVWAFGCCLYEALTARKPFPGDTAAETLAKVLEREPDWSALPSETPFAVERLLRRCLRKKRSDRLRDIGDARLELTEAGAVPLERRAPTPSRAFAYLSGALAAAAVTALAMWLLLPRDPRQSPAPVHRATIVLPGEQSQRRLWMAPFAISRDGRFLAYVAEDAQGSSLFLRALDSFETTRLEGTYGADMPFFSPNGEWIGFFAAGKLKKVSVERGSTLTIASASQPIGGSWGEDDIIVFAPSLSGGLFEVSADGGGIPENLTKPDLGEAGYAHVWPQHLPGTRKVLFSFWDATTRRIGVLDLDSGQWETVADARGALYLSTGHLLYAKPDVGTGLLASSFDIRHPRRMGPAVEVADDVRLQLTYALRPYVSVSDTGTMVYAEERAEPTTLAWMDRHGTIKPIVNRDDAYTPRISPDGTRIVFQEGGSINMLDIERKTVDVIVRGASMYSSAALWHPDGQLIVFNSNVSGDWDLYEVSIPPRGEPVRLLERPYGQTPTSWSPDGMLLAYSDSHPDTGFDLWVLPVGEEPVPVLVTEFNESNAVFSPDGQFLAYVSDASGRREVYVRKYPEGEAHTISTDGGEAPLWSPYGDELFYRRGSAFMVVRITTTPEFHAAVPEVVHEQRFDWELGLFPVNYDVAPGGDRFVVIGDRSTTELKVVFNWFEELERLTSTGR